MNKTDFLTLFLISSSFIIHHSSFSVGAQQPPASKPSVLPQPAGELADQLVAVVNGEVITQSDLVWLSALDPNTLVTHLELPELQRLLAVKIDRVLLNQEAKRIPGITITYEEIKNEERKMVARFPSEMLFRQRMEHVGLTSDALAHIAQEQIGIEKYTNFRFRSFVIVTEEEITAYYRDEVRPKAQQRGTVLPEQPTAEDRQLIETILLESRVDQETTRWLEAARFRAEIIPLAPFARPFAH